MKLRILTAAALFAVGTLAYAGLNRTATTEPVEFHPGHSHEGGVTEGAPSHHGGIDEFGCHSALGHYHCH